MKESFKNSSSGPNSESLQNKPLNLTKEQKKNPLTVLHEFFQSFHLSEIRSRLTNLSDGSGHDFYDRLENMIEAAYLLSSKKDRKPEKNPELENSFKSAINKLVTEMAEKKESFYSPNELLKYVEKAPMHVIIDVFKNEPLIELKVQIGYWQDVALSSKCPMYQKSEFRGRFLIFCEQLLELTEALALIYTKNIENAALKRHIIEANTPTLLKNGQVYRPMEIVTGFFKKFDISYINQEMQDWAEAGIGYARENRQPQVYYTYCNVLCLVRAAHAISLSAEKWFPNIEILNWFFMQALIESGKEGGTLLAKKILIPSKAPTVPWVFGESFCM